MVTIIIFFIEYVILVKGIITYNEELLLFIIYMTLFVILIWISKESIKNFLIERMLKMMNIKFILIFIIMILILFLNYYNNINIHFCEDLSKLIKGLEKDFEKDFEKGLEKEIYYVDNFVHKRVISLDSPILLEYINEARGERIVRMFKSVSFDKLDAWKHHAKFYKIIKEAIEYTEYTKVILNKDHFIVFLNMVLNNFDFWIENFKDYDHLKFKNWNFRIYKMSQRLYGQHFNFFEIFISDEKFINFIKNDTFFVNYIVNMEQNHENFGFIKFYLSKCLSITEMEEISKKVKPGWFTKGRESLIIKYLERSCFLENKKQLVKSLIEDLDIDPNSINGRRVISTYILFFEVLYVYYLTYSFDLIFYSSIIFSNDDKITEEEVERFLEVFDWIKIKCYQSNASYWGTFWLKKELE